MLNIYNQNILIISSILIILSIALSIIIIIKDNKDSFSNNILNPNLCVEDDNLLRTGPLAVILTNRDKDNLQIVGYMIQASDLLVHLVIQVL